MTTIALVWYLFVLLTPNTSTSVNGPMANEPDCRFVERQMAKLKPHKMGCVEVPIYQPQAGH